MVSFIASLFLVTVAELGDKTQLLALSFATRYKPAKVITGIFIALLLLQLLAVTVGQVVSDLIPMQYLRIIVGFSFIGFGIWMLKRDEHDEQGKVREGAHSLGAIVTVTVAFFIAELGDKTQLATISLAAKYHSFINVWLGSTVGMVLADGAAIIAGVFAGKKIPQEKIKYISAVLFTIFGLVTIVQAFL
ncbi:MAG TPA: TMEM165/GDT1 family protein [Anaerolineae bacterium]|nr:TMEM165/GDT1 family protein [Anaerolineae bacterium]